MRSVGKRGNRLGASDFRDAPYAEPLRRGQQRRTGLRARHHDFAHARLLRGNHRHQQRGDQGKSSARKITADCINRAHALSGAYTGFHLYGPFLRFLAVRYGANISCRVIHGGDKFARHSLAGAGQFRTRHPDVS